MVLNTSRKLAQGVAKSNILAYYSAISASLKLCASLVYKDELSNILDEAESV